MHDNKRPSKYIILGVIGIIITIALILFMTLRVQAAGDNKFLDIQEIKTTSGINVWLVEDKSLPVVALQYIFLDTGTTLDPQEKQGLVRMLSNTMDEGAAELTSQDFQKALSDHSITLTFSAGRDGFGGKIKTLSRHKNMAFDLLKKAIEQPRFDADPVARMRDANLARVRSSISQPDWMAARLINDKAFSNHPYSKNSGGTLSGLASITSDDLRAFHKNLSKEKLLIAVVGDISPEEVKKHIDSAFSALPATTTINTPADINIQNAGKVYLYEQPIPQTMIEIMMPAFDRKDKDFYALQVLNYIFGGAGFGSRLMEEAREKRGLTYGIYSSLNDYRHADALSISTSTKNESAAEMLEIIKAEMLRLQNEEVGEKELNDAKSYITGSMPLSLSSTDAIAGMILSMQTNDLPANYLDHYAENIKAVTSADIQRVAKRVLIPENMVTVFVGQPENVTITEKVESLPNVQ